MRKTCTVCLKTKNSRSFYRKVGGVGGRTAACRLCMLEKNKIQRAKNATAIKAYRNKSRRNNPQIRFTRARSAAKRRGLKWTITLEQYIPLATANCNYCDGFFSRVTTGGGLDRLDNSKGYEPDNVVPCCTTCNVVRGDKLTPEETRAAVQAVIALRKAQEAG